MAQSCSLKNEYEPGVGLDSELPAAMTRAEASALFQLLAGSSDDSRSLIGPRTFPSANGRDLYVNPGTFAGFVQSC